ncbi:head-tail connector protein [Tianweitania sediminis]|uniref:PhiE125 gp8 family phage protein n=1 Tax=Tianweitania sediminis TaxID=1502156 RepID=A0A8J7RJJ0_9HYPH|nr:hypothetical protein [Tianweitania sediminis]MBP0438426.1 hypothetical protein [Tianweitania sediminis]
MRRPALVTPPSILPISVAAVKLALRIDDPDLDTEIESQIRSAVDHYEGWTGILGIALAEQSWSQSFDRFFRELALPIGPVIGVDSVTWRNVAGQVATVPPASYALRTDAGGASSIRFDAGYGFPVDLYEREAVLIQYRAGWPNRPLPADAVEGAVPESDVPDDIKTAIKLRVQTMIDEAARVNAVHLGRIESALIGKYRRWSI